MKTYHGSNATITHIEVGGMFDGIFSSSCIRAAISHGDRLYEITSPRPLEDFELNYLIDGAWDAALEICRGDEARAEAIMSPGCLPSSDTDPEDIAEEGWHLQCLRGRLAARLGYTSVEMQDEHGITWLCLPGCEIKEVKRKKNHCNVCKSDLHTSDWKKK